MIQSRSHDVGQKAKSPKIYWQSVPKDPDLQWDEYMRNTPYQTPMPAVPIIAEYFRLVNAIFGTYLAINVSLNEAVRILERNQEMAMQAEKTAIEYLDTLCMSFEKVHPDIPSTYPGDPKNTIHMCSQGGFKKKNVSGGDNQIMAANMCIVMMFTYWEDHYREKIADAAGLDKDDVKKEIMGDLSILRNSIIHHNGYVKTNKNCKILTWFKPGDKIAVDLGQFMEIKCQIEKGLSELPQELESLIKSKTQSGHSL